MRAHVDDVALQYPYATVPAAPVPSSPAAIIVSPPLWTLSPETSATAGSAPPASSEAAHASTSPAPPSYSPASIAAIITAAAQADGVDPSWLVATARCESGLNPYAYNRAGPYEGLMQFLPSTFRAHGGTDIWDPTQQARIAAAMFAAGESSEWPVCSR